MTARLTRADPLAVIMEHVLLPMAEKGAQPAPLQWLLNLESSFQGMD